MNAQRLYRSRTNKVFAGVCGGLGEYFDVDPVIIRVLFILMILFGGSGILLYIAAVIIVPKKPYLPADFEPSAAPEPVQPSNTKYILGYILVIGGILLLLSNFEVFHFFNFLDDAFEFIFPVLLILLGMGIIYYRQSQPEGEKENEQMNRDQNRSAQSSSYKQFKRSYVDRKISGVCGGLAEYFRIDPSIMRLLYIILCFASFGAGVVLYIVLTLAVPYDYAIKS